MTEYRVSPVSEFSDDLNRIEDLLDGLECYAMFPEHNPINKKGRDPFPSQDQEPGGRDDQKNAAVRLSVFHRIDGGEGMSDNMDEFIAVKLERGPSDCPALTREWMDEHGIKYTDSGYHYMLQKMNRHMKSLERYGIVRYTGKVVSSNIRAKIWELDINDEE